MSAVYLAALRRLRYWVGYRLLKPHLRRLWTHYDLMSTDVNPHTDVERRNCTYISIGLLLASSRSERTKSAAAKVQRPVSFSACLAESPRWMLCTLRRGHAGEHVAHGWDDEDVIDAWRDASIPKTAGKY